MRQSQPERAAMWVFLILLGALIFLVGKMIAPYIVPLMMGGILAMLAYPLYRLLLKRGHRQTTAAGLITFLVVFAIVGPMLVLSLIAGKQALALAQQMSENPGAGIISAIEQFKIFGRSFSFLEGSPISVSQFRAEIQQALGSIIKTTSGIVIDTAKSLPDAILQIFLAVLACFFFLVDGKQAINWIMDKMPIETEISEKVKDAFESTAISVIWASMAAAGAQSTIMSITFMALGIPSALLAGAATFIFSWIPLLGSVPVVLAGVVYLYADGSMVKLAILAVMGGVTGLVDNFVRPLVLKGRGEMHPLVSMVAIFGGIHLMGIVGVFLGPIIVAVAITLLKIWPMVGERAGILPDQDTPQGKT